MKNHCDIDHTRHRSVTNFFINLWAGLIAYSFLDHFPAMPPFLPKVGNEQPLQIELV